MSVRLPASVPSVGNSGIASIVLSNRLSVESVTVIPGPSSAESRVIRPDEPTTYCATIAADRAVTVLSVNVISAPLERVIEPGNLSIDSFVAVRTPPASTMISSSAHGLSWSR